MKLNEFLPGTTSPMTQSYALANHPALTYKVVEAGILKKYHEPSIAKSLLRENRVVGSAIESTLEGDSRGEVRIVSENGDIPRIDTDFLKKVRSVDWYGGYIEITLDEVEDGRADAVQTKVENLAYAMQLYEQRNILWTVSNAQGLNTLAGTDWTGSSADPLRDLQKAKNLVKKDGLPADTLVISTSLSEYLSSMDIVKSRIYNTNGSQSFVNTGDLPPLAGLRVVVDDEMDPEGTGVAYVLRTLSCGTWDVRHPIRTYSVDGKFLGKDMVAYKTVALAKANAYISHPKLITKLTGLLG
ncbi:MAG TPA: hypothetical protein O0X46_00040 [Methanocorpusculum sp.]|nr:hypothetical protein [Methanocorpusculum sp.]HJK57155.1 hypothetical protein [Methanocorpusculum sp.]HJK83213.1 hypothetical protein [Methanocorpusculum sp.]